MQYIQLDNFNGNFNITYGEDDVLEPKIFDSLIDAQETLTENCQDGVIIPLGVDIITLLRKCKMYIENPLTGGISRSGLLKQLNTILDLT